MSKHKKHIVAEAPGQSFSTKPDFPEIENRLAGDDGKIPDNAKKESSGVWVLVFLLGLLILLVVQHWLRQ